MLKRINKISISAILIGFILLLTSCTGGERESIIFIDNGTDSIKFHNAIATIILEEGYGIDVEEKTGSSSAAYTGIEKGDIDVHMESWTENNKEIYTKGIEEGYFIKQAVNFDDNFQGLYVPTYVIEGDPERGIEPMAPDLKYITDLPEYWELFQDPENKDQGRIIGAISGWNVDEVLHEGFEYYNLGEHYHYFRPGSESALNSSLVSAYEKGEPWIGYSYEPTWVLGKYDMTPIIEEDPDGPLKTLGAQDVNIITNKELANRLPDAAKFLQNYGTTSDLINDALGYMESEEASSHETAVRFLKENEEVWLNWVSDDVAKKVKDAIN